MKLECIPSPNGLDQQGGLEESETGVLCRIAPRRFVAGEVPLPGRFWDFPRLIF